MGEVKHEDDRLIEVDANQKMSYFYIFHDFGSSISNTFNETNRREISMLTVYTLGAKILDFLEIIHEAGYVHNNIYLDKVLLG